MHPGEPDVPEIGDEVAAARALSELAHRLLDAAAENIQAAMAGPDRTM
ncbi:MULTISPECIES: dsRBD fold-containing protein [unclassified Frankia]